jgi:hypothetical protein
MNQSSISGNVGAVQNVNFDDLAEYLAELDSANNYAPPGLLQIPPVKGRDILFRMLENLARGQVGVGRHERLHFRASHYLAAFMVVNESAGQLLLKAIRAKKNNHSFGIVEDLARGHRLRIKRYGHVRPNGIQHCEKKARTELIRDTFHYDDKASARYESYTPSASISRKSMDPPPTVGKAETPGKAATTKRLTPAEPVEGAGQNTFTKIPDWVNKIQAKPTDRMILAEIIRNACGCPFTWVGNTHLGEVTQLSTRQVRRYLIRLEAEGHITIRNYRGTWCKSGRIIFVNRLAASAGVDPVSVTIPEGRSDFWKFRARFGGQNKQKKTQNKTGNHEKVSCYIRGTKRLGGYDTFDPRRDKGFSASKEAEKNHTGVIVSTSPPEGVLPLPPVEKTNTDPTKTVRQTRPSMRWPEDNLPVNNRESILAKMVRQGRVTHLHPKWLDGLACWVVRWREMEGKKVYLEPKLTHDQWIENTADAVVVPLIGPDNRYISQSEFISLLRAGPIVAPDPGTQLNHHHSPLVHR